MLLVDLFRFSASPKGSRSESTSAFLSRCNIKTEVQFVRPLGQATIVHHRIGNAMGNRKNKLGTNYLQKMAFNSVQYFFHLCSLSGQDVASSVCQLYCMSATILTPQSAYHGSFTPRISLAKCSIPIKSIFSIENIYTLSSTLSLDSGANHNNVLSA